MRRWILILFLLGVFFALSWLNKNKLQRRFPFLKRLDTTLTITAWVMLVAYCFAFLYWLYTQVIKK